MIPCAGPDRRRPAGGPAGTVRMHEADNPYAPPKSDVAVPISRPAVLYLSETIFYAVSTLLLAWLYSRIGRGRNWARITFLVLMLISVPAMVDHYPELRADAVWHLVLDPTVLAMECAAAYLLLTRPAASWFRAAV
jgi:hypothetical protein